MKKFISNLLKILFVFGLIYSCIIVANYYHTKNTPLRIPPDKNILILGDSNTESAINDTILDNSINLSHSADPFFYSFLKLRKILPANNHIDTVLLSFSPHNLFKNDWTFNEKHIHSRFGQYYPLMTIEDIRFLSKGNLRAVLTSSPSIIQQVIRNIPDQIKGKNPISAMVISMVRI